MPFSTIITTANMASRASVGLPCPVDMTAPIIMTSIPITDSVRTSVPNGSPSFTATLSAWRTTARADNRIAPKSHKRTKVNQAGLDRPASQPGPNPMKRAVVTRLTPSAHSRRSTGMTFTAPFF